MFEAWMNIHIATKKWRLHLWVYAAWQKKINLKIILNKFLQTIGTLRIDAILFAKTNKVLVIKAETKHRNTNKTVYDIYSYIL